MLPTCVIISQWLPGLQVACQEVGSLWKQFKKAILVDLAFDDFGSSFEKNPPVIPKQMIG